MIAIDVLKNLHLIFKEDPKQAFDIAIKMLSMQSYLINELQDCLHNSALDNSTYKSCLQKIYSICRKMHNENVISLEHFDILNLIDSILLKEVTLKDSVQISSELQISEAAALSQFLKRIGFTEFRAMAANDEEAYEAQAGAEKIRKALADKGFDPR